MHRERYERFAEKVERFKLDRGGLGAYDMNASHLYAFMECEAASGRVDGICKAYKFGMLQALRFASKHSREECAEIVRGVDQIENAGDIRQGVGGCRGRS